MRFANKTLIIKFSIANSHGVITTIVVCIFFKQLTAVDLNKHLGLVSQKGLKPSPGLHRSLIIDSMENIVLDAA